jgi:hypothetical protein
LRNAIRYSIASKEFGVEATRELPGFDGRALTTLLDGAFLYTSAAGLVRLFAGRSITFPLPHDVGRVWRLLPAERIDQAWYVTQEGEAFLLELGAHARIRRRFRSHDGEGGPFDFAVAHGTLAFLSVYESPQEPRRFVLNLYSATGTQTKSHQLGSVTHSEDSDWATRISRDHELAITGSPPRVAVGGPSSLRLFNTVAGDEIVIHGGT